MKYEFDGITTESLVEPSTEDFYEMYNETLIEKKPFTVELDDKEIELHLFIEDTDMAEYEDTENHIITIGVVPAFKSLSKDHQDDILNQYDIAEDREKLKEDIAWQLEDAISYGFGLPLRTVTVTNPDDVEYTIKSAIAVRHAVSGLIGFELDRYMNRIGNTGWDFLADYCTDKDLLQMAMARFEK